jgi:hypothetical protein
VVISRGDRRKKYGEGKEMKYHWWYKGSILMVMRKAEAENVGASS